MAQTCNCDTTLLILIKVHDKEIAKVEGEERQNPERVVGEREHQKQEPCGRCSTVLNVIERRHTAEHTAILVAAH